MASSNGMQSFLIGGAALGLGAALAWKLTNEKKGPVRDSHEIRNRQTIENFKEHWSPTMRFAVGAIGGGLMIYGMRSSGNMARVAVTTGAGLLTRSVTDTPIHDWGEVLKPQALLQELTGR